MVFFVVLLWAVSWCCKIDAWTLFWKKNQSPFVLHGRNNSMLGWKQHGFVFVWTISLTRHWKAVVTEAQQPHIYPQINPHTQSVCRSLFWWWHSKDLWQALFFFTSPPLERSCVQGVCVWVCFQRPWIMIRAVGRVSTKSSTHNAKRNYHRET